MTSKITLPPWPGTTSTPTVAKTTEPETVADVLLSDDVRKQIVKALDCLHVDYEVGHNRLRRKVGVATDLKSIFENRKMVPGGLIADIAQATSMTVPELLEIKELNSERKAEVEAHLKSNDLIEPLRGFMVNRRRYSGD